MAARKRSVKASNSPANGKSQPASFIRTALKLQRTDHESDPHIQPLACSKCGATFTIRYKDGTCEACDPLSPLTMGEIEIALEVNWRYGEPIPTRVDLNPDFQALRHWACTEFRHPTFSSDTWKRIWWRLASLGIAKQDYLAISPKDMLQLIDGAQSVQQDSLDTACLAAPDKAHSVDFRSVRWGDQTFSLTATQAVCIKVLWESWKAGTPEVGESTILEAVETNGNRLRDVFGKRHQAWNTLIVSGKTKGTYRLAFADGRLERF